MSRLSAVLVLSAMAQMCAFAGSYYVDVDNASASDSNPGTEVLPFKTIQAAVEAAEDSGSGYSYSDGDTIWVKPGVYDAGGREGSNGFTNRVYITKPLRIVSTQGKEKTSIVGAWDPNGSNGCGPAAVRCVYVASTVANAIIRGFTITKGATPSWTTDTSANYSGGIFGTSSSIWIVECTVSECRARRFPAMYYCTGVRTLYVHNKSDYVWGTVGGQSRFLNCVLWANGNGNKYTPVEYGTVVNCTLVDNLKNGYDTASVYNTIVVSSGGSANDYCMTGTSSNIISTASHGSRQIMSSATGDFRLLPTSAAIGAGERSLLTKITLPAELSDQQYKDYLGADIVEKDGRINCGAVQAVGSPKGGGIVLNFTAEVDDSFSSVISGSYVFGELYPTQHIVKPVISTAGIHVYALRIDPRLDNLDGLSPDPENRFYLAPSPNANTNDEYNLLTSSNVKWVDPDPEGLGSDDNDGNTESTPYKTLEKAMVFARSNQRTIVYCKKGVYDETPTGSYRLSMPNSYYCFVRAVDGPENTVIRGGAGIGCVSMPYFGALQGFTLTGADTSGSAVNAAVRVYQQNRLTWLLDCIVSNNVSGSEAVLSGPWLQRCLVAGNRAAAKGMYKTQLSSSVACNNVSDGDDYIIHEGKAWQSTIYNADGGKLLRDVNCYNSIVVGGGEVSASCSGATSVKRAKWSERPSLGSMCGRRTERSPRRNT